jgi:hypothetical protein
VSVHTPHPPIETAGLHDGCPRCDEHARDPFATLDESTLRHLGLRIHQGRPARSDNEARAMAVLNRAMQHTSFVRRLITHE